MGKKVKRERRRVIELEKYWGESGGKGRRKEEDGKQERKAGRMDGRKMDIDRERHRDKQTDGARPIVGNLGKGGEHVAIQLV